jgi:hypothetical protein
MRPVFLIVVGLALWVIGGFMSVQAIDSQAALKSAIASGDVDGAKSAAAAAYGSNGSVTLGRIVGFGGIALTVFGIVQAVRTRGR